MLKDADDQSNNFSSSSSSAESSHPVAAAVTAISTNFFLLSLSVSFSLSTEETNHGDPVGRG